MVLILCNIILDKPLAHRNVVAAYNLGDGATFWKLFLALIGDNIYSVYNYQ